MKLLSRSEEIILLSIWRLQDNAYGMSIRERVAEVTGNPWSFGAIYAPLNRLLRKGLIRAIEGEPTPERGGRRKIFYQLTTDGKQALKRTRKVHEAIWLGIPSLDSRSGRS
jgi:PadR family transcriptional regulator PadR